MNALRTNILLLVFACLASSAWAASWSAIDFPGATNTYPWGVSPGGDVVGSYDVSGDPVIHGFLLRSGVFATIDYPGASATYARGMNTAGTICGYYFDGAD